MTRDLVDCTNVYMRTALVRLCLLMAVTALCLTLLVPQCYAYSRGVNYSGLEGGTVPGRLNWDYNNGNAQDFQYWNSKGLTLIRLPILWERVQPTLNGPLDTNYVNTIWQTVNWAKASGDSVIIDVHNYGRYNGTPIDNGAVTSANFNSLWSQLSAQFKNEPTVVAYDLMNEPHDMGSANWPNISQSALNTIRGNGDTKLICVEGNGWASAGGWTSSNPSTSWISDSANNFKYEAHTYFDHDNTGTYGWSYDQELSANSNVAQIGVQRLNVFTNWCSANHVQGYLGEYGCPRGDARWLTVLNNFLTALDAANMDGTYWTAGDWYGTDANSLTCQPTNNYTTDAPQVATLVAHLGQSGLPNGTYTLIPACQSGCRLDAWGAGQTNGTGVGIYTSNGGLNQKWVVTLTSPPNTYAIRNANTSNLVLDADGGKTANGTKVQLWQDFGSTNQRWNITSLGNGKYKLNPSNSSAVALDVNGGANGANVQLWQDYTPGNLNQVWSFSTGN